MFITSSDIAAKLPKIANSHFAELFKSRLQQAIEKKVNKLTNKNHRAFFEYLREDNYSYLNKIITSKPSQMRSLLKDLTKYPNVTYRSKKTKPKRFGDHLNDVFNYTWFSNKKSSYNAYMLAEKLGSNTCLYCNRSFTLTLQKGNDRIVRPEFDHFLPKSRYPFFSLSFYNLIPACHICNSNLKLASDFNSLDYLHPYAESFDDALKFTVSFSKTSIKKKSLGSYPDLLGMFYGKLDSFQISLIPRNSTNKASVKRAKANVTVFHLEDLYNNHKDVVVEILQNAIIYNETNIEALYQQYSGILFRDKTDILRFLTRNYIDEPSMPNRIFSKLSRDIHREFGIKF